ncbi:MAG: TonB-dependent receptor, partial [Crocinitomicaceae bacterium]|nr:TonB-dependent receptor [Crocinitomicaceae bacterium]
MLQTVQRLFGLLILLFVVSVSSVAQTTISGNVTDQSFGQEVLGARVTVKGTKIFTETDELGNFKITTNGSFPVTLIIEAFGFEPTDYIVKSEKQKVRIEIGDNTTLLDGVEIQKINISSKQKESALTVESMSLMAIKECPAADFYEGLGALKGVDLTAASIGFKVINTRGFNSTSPVRSLQIIDGVDNQAPGLNFSLGNFLGSSELDLKKVDLIVGASSSFYGP